MNCTYILRFKNILSKSLPKIYFAKYKLYLCLEAMKQPKKGAIIMPQPSRYVTCGLQTFMLNKLLYKEYTENADARWSYSPPVIPQVFFQLGIE